MHLEPLKGHSAKVLDKGWVELQDFMGGDESVEKRARVSNLPIRYEEEERSPEQTQKLINYLMRNRHGSPFEGSVFELYIKCPLFVRSEWHRHRMASYNEMSGRYVEYEPEFYIPEQIRVQAKTNKQGSIIPDEEFKANHTFNWELVTSSHIIESSESAYKTYKLLLYYGVAKEMARMILPVNLYTAFYMTVNARSLMNFLSLRNADNAQWEIRQYAIAIEDFFEEAMPMTYKAWLENGRVAP